MQTQKPTQHPGEEETILLKRCTPGPTEQGGVCPRGSRTNVPGVRSESLLSGFKAIARNWQDQVQKARQLELGQQTPSQVKGGWVSRIGPGNLRSLGLPPLWCLCGSEDRRCCHRGPTGWSVPGCSFLFWLMKG